MDFDQVVHAVASGFGYQAGGLDLRRAWISGILPQWQGVSRLTLQAFLDESYAPDGVLVLGGYISTAERWSEFAADWEGALPDAVRKPDGTFAFKMSAMAQFPDRMSRVSKFHNIIQRHALMALSFTIDKRDLRAAKERLYIDGVSIDWEEGLDIYYVAFRLLMEHFHNIRTEELIEMPIARDEIVDFFFDDNSKKNTILEIWEGFIDTRLPGYREMYGGTPRFESDDAFLPLQAADFLVWWQRKWTIENGIEGAVDGKYTGFEPAEQKLFHLSLAVDEDRIAETLKGWMMQSILAQGRDPRALIIRDSGRRSR